MLLSFDMVVMRYDFLLIQRLDKTIFPIRSKRILLPAKRISCFYGRPHCNLKIFDNFKELLQTSVLFLNINRPAMDKTTPVIDQYISLFGNNASSSEILMSTFDGINVFWGTSYQEREAIYRESRQVPYLHMYFSLEGASSSHEENTGKQYFLTDNQHTISYEPTFDGYYTVSGPKVKSFGISLPSSFFQKLILTDNESLKRFWDKALTGNSVDMTAHPMPITARQKMVILDMQHCSFTGDMKKLFYESKILELFLLQAEQAEKLNGKRASPLKPQDVEKLQAARHFVYQHMLEPISLSQISKATGLNEFKLKRGFKSLFGTTVFEYLIDLKMNYARQMLLNTSCTIFEVAYTLGYSEPYNFSKAFKKHFGYVPSQLKESFNVMH
jgi:AraC family transcriptional activator of pyochelin receptor